MWVGAVYTRDVLTGVCCMISHSVNYRALILDAPIGNFGREGVIHLFRMEESKDVIFKE